MKRLKNISRYIEPFKIRPLLGVAIIILLFDVIYVNLIFKWPAEDEKMTKGDISCISGKVREKTYDEEGNLKSVTIGDTICYVNKVQISEEPLIGSLVEASGERFIFEKPLNPGGFNQKYYYGSNRVFFYQYTESLRTVSKGKYTMREGFLNIQRRLTEKVKTFCPRESGTINTLLLADKSGLSDCRKTLYQRAGVGHFLVISGLHISAVGLFLYHALRRTGLKTKPACIFAMCFLFLYGMLVGFSVSVVRALIMFSLRLFSDIVRKIYDMLSAVSLALSVTVLVNPLCILNSGFIYSYVTVFAISVYITYVYPKKFRCFTRGERIREVFRIPVVLWLFVMPVTLIFSYECSWASILINSVLAPMSGPILLMSFLCLGFSVTGLAFLAKTADWILWYILNILDTLCKLGTASQLLSFVGKPTLVRVILYYGILLTYLLILKSFLPKVSGVIVVLFSVSFLTSMKIYKPYVGMLYVGQGECCVVSTAPHSAVIIDCGSTSENEVGRYTVEPFLKAMGIYKIQGIFISHSDTDHLSGAFELLEDARENGFKTENLFLQDIPRKMADDTLVSLYRLAVEKKVSVHFLEAFDEVLFNDVRFTCLWPSYECLTGESNGDSMVLLMREGPFSMLFTGDATATTEEALTPAAAESLAGPLCVLKVSHHGSKTATSPRLLALLEPGAAVISAGIDNPYGHPHADVLSRLEARKIPYAVTAQSGYISIYIKKDGFVLQK